MSSNLKPSFKEVGADGVPRLYYGTQEQRLLVSVDLELIPHGLPAPKAQRLALELTKQNIWLPADLFARGSNTRFQLACRHAGIKDAALVNRLLLDLREVYNDR